MSQCIAAPLLRIPREAHERARVLGMDAEEHYRDALTDSGEERTLQGGQGGRVTSPRAGTPYRWTADGVPYLGTVTGRALVTGSPVGSPDGTPVEDFEITGPR